MNEGHPGHPGHAGQDGMRLGIVKSDGLDVLPKSPFNIVT